MAIISIRILACLYDIILLGIWTQTKRNLVFVKNPWKSSYFFPWNIFILIDMISHARHLQDLHKSSMNDLFIQIISDWCRCQSSRKNLKRGVKDAPSLDSYGRLTVQMIHTVWILTDSCIICLKEERMISQWDLNTNCEL